MLSLHTYNTTLILHTFAGAACLSFTIPQYTCPTVHLIQKVLFVALALVHYGTVWYSVVLRRCEVYCPGVSTRYLEQGGTKQQAQFP